MNIITYLVYYNNVLFLIVGEEYVMAIGDQFSGLDMKNLIGAPLSAASDASVQLAQSTANFINTVGFDKNGKARTAAFKFNKVEDDPDGNKTNNEMNVDVPLLAIVPIPNLQVDEVNILFDMEVKQSEQNESSNDYGGSFSGSGSIFGFRVTVSGSISSHSSNTRSSDNSAKYHVDVSATNHGTPEGLARVLDMMAANVAPTLVNSTSVDQTGKPLSGDTKAKNDKIKELRAKQAQCDTAVNASGNAFNIAVNNFKREASNLQSKYSIVLSSVINKLDEQDPKYSDDLKKYTDEMQTINEDWNGLQAKAKDIITSVAIKSKMDSQPPAQASDTEATPNPIALTDVIKLHEVDDNGVFGDFKLETNTQLSMTYNNAAFAYINYLNCQDKSADNEKKYQEALL